MTASLPCHRITADEFEAWFNENAPENICNLPLFHLRQVLSTTNTAAPPTTTTPTTPTPTTTPTTPTVSHTSAPHQ